VKNADSEWETNQAIVEAAREDLRRAAAHLTPEIEAAAIYAIKPHCLPAEVCEEDDE
jgi:hypothetical protein